MYIVYAKYVVFEFEWKLISLARIWYGWKLTFIIIMYDYNAYRMC